MILDRFRNYLENRLPRSDSWALTQSSIYILPTRAGWAFAVTLVVMLLTSINYQLNLGYVLTFLLCGAGLVAMQQTHANLRGLTLRVRSPQPVFAGEPAPIDIVLDNPGRERHGLGLGLYRAGHKGMAWVDAPALGAGSARLSFVPQRRGRHLLPTIMAETNFPLGLFRAWTVWRPAAEVLVYPRPEQPAQALPALQQAPGAVHAAQHGSGGEFEGVRAYRRGDPMRQVVWKKVARNNELVSRDASTSASQELWLDLPRGLPDTEAQLSRLAAWVLAADRLGVNYGLRLPGHELPCASGDGQRRTALQALACWQ
ncbi:DUF58 domain-containing protein [Ideonella sp. A 288]|uniref:DUF58 domain-containing protein n=1 Tax=Ideonella sp. A 288 TaxID=1962181 RepID=UPI000B4B29C3|nr:DUF58 domain-containing protein [Ideonella sp. A 288]